MNCLAIVVNYRCAPDTVAAVRSLTDDPCCDAICVIDNSESAGEADFLRAHLPGRARLTVCERNLGFAGACNLAFEADDAESVLLLNPDARLLPGALERLLSTLAANDGLAAIAPAIFWDDELRFLLPTLLPEEPGWWLLAALASRWPDRIGTAAARAWLGWQQRLHNAESPQPANYLSGAALLLRRSAVRRAGGLFDPEYFMFFEDTDLCRRLRHAGYGLALLPTAQGVHRWRNRPHKADLMAQSAPVYAARHFPRFVALARRLGAPRAAPCAPLARPPDLRAGRWGVGRMLPRPARSAEELAGLLDGRGVIAVSPSPLGFPAAFRPADSIPLPPDDILWQSLEPTRHLVLTAGPEGGRWFAFDKT